MSTENSLTASMCRSCKTRPATTTYIDRGGNWSEKVCYPCFERHDIEGAFAWGLVDNRALYQEERYDEVLAWLDEFEATHHHRIDDSLARRIAAERAHTYWYAERYEEMLAASEKRHVLGYEYVWDRWHVADLKACALEGLGRHAEALTVFEEAFRQQDPRLLHGACFNLPTLVKYSTNAGKPVDESWRKLGHDIADHYHVEFPDRPTLAESLLALFDMTEKKNCVYEDESEPQSQDKP